MALAAVHTGQLTTSGIVDGGIEAERIFCMSDWIPLSLSLSVSVSLCLSLSLSVSLSLSLSLSVIIALCVFLYLFHDFVLLLFLARCHRQRTVSINHE